MVKLVKLLRHSRLPVIRSLSRLFIGLAIALPTLSAHADRTQAGTPESLLLNVYRLMSEGQSDAALTTANQLVEQYPTFNLGHLVRGDLLMSRVRPVTTVGDVRPPSETGERLSDLREEARGRLQALTSPAPTNLVPDVLIKLSPEQKHLLVVDTSKARLYLFAHQEGELRYQTDYYVTIGKAGSDKQSTGDQKTPLGIYRITGSIPGNKLTDFYGKGALTLNYPNTWDQQRGRTGYGIWLHGVPSSSYNRPPKASNGCVVLANPDMESLMNKIQPGTHVVITNKLSWRSPEAWKAEQARFMAYFSTLYTTSGRQSRDLPPLESASLFRYPNAQLMIQVSFPQKETSREQYWSYDGNQWRPVQRAG